MHFRSRSIEYESLIDDYFFIQHGHSKILQIDYLIYIISLSAPYFKKFSLIMNHKKLIMHYIGENNR